MQILILRLFKGANFNFETLQVYKFEYLRYPRFPKVCWTWATCLFSPELSGYIVVLGIMHITSSASVSSFLSQLESSKSFGARFVIPVLNVMKIMR